MASPDLNKDLTCSNCLNVFSDLVKIWCGHNFCRHCFGCLLGSNKLTGIDVCPVCKCMVTAKPGEQLDRRSESEVPAKDKQEAAKIYCTYCIRSPVPANQSCLQCEASLCAKHLLLHTKSPEHILTKPTSCFKDSKCSIHEKVFDLYCSQDNLCICILCNLNEHRGHQVYDFHEAFQMKKKNLEYSLEILTNETEQLKARVQNLCDQKFNLQEKASNVAERVCALFRNIRKQQEDLERRILSDIAWQEQKMVISVSNRIHDLEEKQDELSKKIGDLTELYETPNPMLFSCWLKSEGSDLHKLRRTSSMFRKRDIQKDYSLDEFDEDSIFQTLHAGLLETLTAFKKGFYVQEASDLLLDSNTAANNVAISEDLKELSCPGTDQFCINNEKRFDFSQVLSTRKFHSGRHYWDVEVGDSGNFRIGVAYSTIERKGGRARIGNNDKSWCLAREDDTIYVIHDTYKTLLERDFSGQRIRIYLDYEAGQISCYELGDSIQHLHTFTTTFTEPLHAAFCVFLTSWVRILS